MLNFQHENRVFTPKTPKNLEAPRKLPNFALSFEGKTSRVDERQARNQSAHSAERLGTQCGKARKAQPSGSAEGEKRLEARMVGTEVANMRIKSFKLTKKLYYESEIY